MMEDLKRCVREAQEITEEISDSDLRIKAFEIILTKLIDMQVGKSNTTIVQTGESEASAEYDEYPVITPSGTANNIRALFASEWGKKRRTSSDVSKALDANGVPDAKHVSTILNRLVQSKELLRIKQDGAFVFWRNPAIRE